MIKGSIQPENMTFVNIYVYKANSKRNLKIDSNIIIVGDYNNPLTSMDRSFRQKINKEKLALNTR